MRQLKYHEEKLLKKVNFFQWKSDKNVREIQILRRYRVQNRDDYHKYNKIAGLITKLTSKLKELRQDDPTRVKTTELLIDKLYNMGLISTKKSLLQCEKIPTSAFCRRRLPVVLVRLKFCENLKEAVTFVEQGHIRIGPEVVTDPAFHVTRSMEDFITWVDSSKIRRKVMKYNDAVDDFDLLQA
ncbi:hypothetical protein GUITHDRAFT_138906 [Guillardia theta CCMP2712]|uniref:U3 small nucleolar ribonucleoprotein protein IMP3 n=1 Tax=Guillardia theta (strain CCMP2712) TaxID=905079 RepID=L1JBM1_GUITC|nr:hypothetical protein GUITHDRAFT_138906 [Guillardia theta CCMP2712]EKX45707.1 hypothetical protein GUITHDRAFT_138906 [Guillardia theta CCMP2712]|mmetsp:Transcript_21104/g.70298  ORF Transcript_21104/g.70298 Transcript_21104/m.70298 type:complete len:184 (-) Transcript_21104:90-641(-)|eukprot:XP_005832687.1 hypothetical protein GUITHDRAFT_138906 [Guillardia theta CCMP2712]